jgi:hypothetical protein
MRALRRPPPPPRQETLHLPAPTGGLNTVSGGTAMPPEDCVKLYNMVSGQHGLRSRQGYRVFNTGAGSPIRTIIPYKGSTSNGSKDRIFAVLKDSIYDMTPGTHTGTSDFVYFAKDLAKPNVGRGVYATFTTAAGQFLLYCDEAAGYHVYTESSGSWSEVTQGVGATQISGVDPNNLCFVTVWKSRVWFVEKDSTNVWYLAAGSIYGTATKLDVGLAAQFRQGGDVIGIWPWTLDGGIGIDDHLVFAARGGDVAIYAGTDPASATTFALKGTWNAGAFVSGRRIASNFGGDLLLLTKSGIRPLSQLVNGQDGQATYLTAKVANLFNELATARGDLPGWDMCLHPDESALIVTVPLSNGDGEGNYSSEQLVMSLWNRSWSRFRDLPISAMAVWVGKLYFADGSTISAGNAYLWVSDGYVDNNRTDAGGAAGTAVQWACLTSFSDFGSPAQKQVQWIRPTLLANAYPPTFSVAARYNFDFSELASVTEVAGTSGDVFDVAIWDSSVFTDDALASQAVRSATGMGNKVAIAIRGTARSRTVLVGIDVGLTRGGAL